MQEMPTENDKHSFEGSDPATLFREFAAECLASDGAALGGKILAGKLVRVVARESLIDFFYGGRPWLRVTGLKISESLRACGT